MEESIVAVVVTYNRKELLVENIECLIAQKPYAPAILVIDNHSTDGTREYISQYIEDRSVEYIDTGANLGGAGGFSFGLKYAAEQGYDYIWLMDDDSMPKPTALKELVKANTEIEGEIGFLASKVIWTDGSICNMNIQRTSALKKVTDYSSSRIPVVVSSFVSLFVSSRVVSEVGLPFKEFFIWTDDWEYTKRIANKYPCYLITDSVVVHKTASNTGSNIAVDSEERFSRYEYAYRNEMFFYRREGIKGLLYYGAKLMLHGYRVIRYAPNKKGTRLKIIYTNALKGLAFNPKVEYPNKTSERRI